MRTDTDDWEKAGPWPSSMWSNSNDTNLIN